jgi:hypothetical protein
LRHSAQEEKEEEKDDLCFCLCGGWRLFGDYSESLVWWRAKMRKFLDDNLSDTQLLDWLQSQTKGYGKGWICRDSFTGRGMRLHETNMEEANPSIRQAIRDAIAIEQKGD